jgi:transcriptional regulator with PAS, ATPase and Fis domain
MKPAINDWALELPAAITVTDACGTIIGMNERSIATFAKSGGEALLGSDVLDCHPESVRSKVGALLQTPNPNHYTIRKNGQRKIIHQLPWYQEGKFAGVVEISVPIPDNLPHFERD